MPSISQLRQQITSQIVEAIESGETLPWRMPWRMPWRCDPNVGIPRNVISQQSYNGINPLLIWVASERLGLQSKWWGTFKQWTELGFQIKKRPSDVPPGCWGTKKAEENEDESQDQYLVARQITLFCADQVEGAAQFQVGTQAPSDFEEFELAEKLIAATGVTINYGGSRAFYESEADKITLPPKHSFDPVGSFYETVFHELAHWAECRVSSDRRLRSYEAHELVAELAATFLSAELGIPQPEGLGNHAAYLQAWLNQMKEDPSFIFVAARQASHVANFLLSFLPENRGELKEGISDIKPQSALAG
ncbi:ArdC family protein [Rubinisphaera sp. JC750]|uniref:ArdC family protein n=1 Tax=Rubinisphaera sp. JC750 TaxID=2898658 RepID=UPI001F2F99E1|nr:zincin-like metallopeptidase domain-containing protein [Rubinisphaera sp. JC750]